MDRRIEKSKKALRAAFWQLREKKSIQDIKISELCQAADVNKTTFYAHYLNIYELAEDVEKHLLHKVISDIPHAQDYTFENMSSYTIEVTRAFERHRKEVEILFRDSGVSHLGAYLEQVMKAVIFDKHPQLKNNAELNFMLSYCIHGAFNASMSNPDTPLETRISVLETILQALQPVMKQILLPQAGSKQVCK